MHSLGTILALSGLILTAIVVSLVVHSFQKRTEVKQATVRELMTQSKTLVQLLQALGEVPVNPQLYKTLCDHLARLAKTIQTLSANDPGLSALQQALCITQAKTPPSTHVAFSPGVTFQQVIKGIKNTPSFIDKQLNNIKSEQAKAWKASLAILALEVEQAYYVRVSDTLWQNGKNREAINAINHALNVLEQCKHMALKERTPIAEALKEKKQKIRNEAE